MGSFRIAGVRLLPLLAGLLLSGCAEHWAKPGGTKAELDGTMARCEADSYQRFPEALQRIRTSEGHYEQGEKRCWTENGQRECRRGEDVWVPPSFSYVDVNANGRDRSRVACMYQHGWVNAEDEKQAAAIENAPRQPTKK